MYYLVIHSISFAFKFQIGDMGCVPVCGGLLCSNV